MCRRRSSRRARSRSAIREPCERLVADGHELGCHGMTHTAFTSLDRAGGARGDRASARDSSCVRAGDVVSRAVSAVSGRVRRYARGERVRDGLVAGAVQARILSTAARTRTSSRSRVGDVIGAEAPTRGSARVSGWLSRPDRAVRASVGVRGPPPRATATRLPFQDRRRRARLRRGGLPVVWRRGRAVRANAGARARLKWPRFTTTGTDTAHGGHGPAERQLLRAATPTLRGRCMAPCPTDLARNEPCFLRARIARSSRAAVHRRRSRSRARQSCRRDPRCAFQRSAIASR